MENKLSAAQHNMERNMLNITNKDRNTNMWVRDQTKVMDIMEIIKIRNGHRQVTSAAEGITYGMHH